MKCIIIRKWIEFGDIDIYVCSSAGINESYQMGLFQVLAAILHLGNVEIKDRDSDSSVIPVRIIFVLQFWLSATLKLVFVLFVAGESLSFWFQLPSYNWIDKHDMIVVMNGSNSNVWKCQQTSPTRHSMWRGYEGENSLEICQKYFNTCHSSIIPMYWFNLSCAVMRTVAFMFNLFLVSLS